MSNRIGEYEIREDSRELLHNGAPEKVEPLIFKLLLIKESKGSDSIDLKNMPSRSAA